MGPLGAVGGREGFTTVSFSVAGFASFWLEEVCAYLPELGFICRAEEFIFSSVWWRAQCIARLPVPN